MTNDQITTLKVLLESRPKAIERTTATLKNELLQVAEVRPLILQNSLDHAKEEGDLNTRIEIHELNIAARNRLRAALDRIIKGNYGRCLECDEWISHPRLKVHPEASHCIQCQSAAEGRPVIKETRHAFVYYFSHWIMREAA